MRQLVPHHNSHPAEVQGPEENSDTLTSRHFLQGCCGQLLRLQLAETNSRGVKEGWGAGHRINSLGVLAGVERRLEDPGRKDDLVLGRGVIGVHCGRRHAPAAREQDKPRQFTPEISLVSCALRKSRRATVALRRSAQPLVSCRQRTTRLVPRILEVVRQSQCRS